jgi:hypothetical protein
MVFAFLRTCKFTKKVRIFYVAIIDDVEDEDMDTPRKHYRLIEQLEASSTSVV